jgi:phosphoribosylformimino-5-aminoimidazole carboxamide ribotide isomerase
MPIEIIPAIDIIEGKCVRLSQGDYAQKKIYNEHPLEVAKQFEGAGIKRLHLVDLDGAKKGSLVNQKTLETIASKTNLIIDFGGGIKTDNDIQSVYNAGAKMAAIGSIAVKKPELFYSWINQYSAEKILLGADVKNECIAISGWMEETKLSVFDFIRKNISKGIKNIFCTDISKDGMLQGAAVELYKKIIKNTADDKQQINLIASGGISSMQDIQKTEAAGCTGVIIGKAIYEGKIKLEELIKVNTF